MELSKEIAVFTSLENKAPLAGSTAAEHWQDRMTCTSHGPFETFAQAEHSSLGGLALQRSE